MDWARHVGAYETRAHLVSAQAMFSPMVGWPPDWADRFPVQFSGREVRFAEIAVALSVVSSNSPFWEAQAQILDYCSAGQDSPAPQWETLAGLGPDEREWQYQEGLPTFLTRAQLAVPHLALVSAGRVMTGSFHPDVLDGLGYVVLHMADLEECTVACEERPRRERDNCMASCLAGRLGQGQAEVETSLG
jgi:hypothetical protein